MEKAEIHNSLSNITTGKAFNRAVEAAFSRVSFVSTTRLEFSREVKKSLELANKSHHNGKSLTSAGIILMALPEPATTVAGVPLFIAGKFLEKKMSSMGVKDIISAGKSVLESLNL